MQKLGNWRTRIWCTRQGLKVIPTSMQFLDRLKIKRGPFFHCSFSIAYKCTVETEGFCEEEKGTTFFFFFFLFFFFSFFFLVGGGVH